jgi:hypothetical protein
MCRGLGFPVIVAACAPMQEDEMGDVSISALVSGTRRDLKKLKMTIVGS